jgi:hypothetical protein
LIDIKRLSGTGTAEMSMDGGATYTTLDLSKPIFNGICRPSILAQTVTDPTVVLRFNTAGDTWLVDFVELSDGIEAEYEPVATTTVAVKGWRDRAAAFTTDLGPLGPWLLSQPTQVLYFEYAQRVDGALIASDADLQVSSQSAAGVTFQGLATANFPNLSPDFRLTVINKAMMWRSPTGSAVCLNGGTVAKGSGFTPTGTGTHWDFGTNGAGNLHMRGRIKRFWCGSFIPSDAVMQAFTT